MAEIGINHDVVGRICRDALRNLQGSGAHPLEIMLGLAEAVGRIATQTDATDAARIEMINFAVQHIGRTLEAHRNYVKGNLQ